jgi:hypothetical protein
VIVRHAVRILALAPIFGGCGGALDRAEPPSGAVDPGVHGLASPGASTPVANAGPAALPAGGVDPRLLGPAGTPGAAPAAVAPAARAAGGEPVSVATGKVVMTREHCETLGRKFAELTMQQGGALGELGAGSAGDHEADGVRRTFSEGCVRDLVGQPVEAREYQCMLRAKSPDALLACKR